MKRCIEFALVICFLCCSLAAMADADLTYAETLLEAGKPAEAYAALEPYEFDMAGNQDFDYLLGVAALDSGKPEKAILIFDRLLTANPNFAGARMDQGRAYFALHSDALAKQQFEIVLSENPPQLAKQTAEKYLATIEDRGKAKIDNLTAYAEFAFGHDSNVNASTSQSQIVIPALGNANFTLSSNNLETPSYFFSASGGAEYTHVISPKLKIFMGGDVSKVDNPEASAFHNGNIAAHAGLTYGEDENNISLSFQTSRFYLGLPNRDTNGVTALWKYTVNPRYQFSAFGSFNMIRYDSSALMTEDINQAIGGINWLYALDEAGKTLISTTLFTGNENDEDHRADGGKLIRGGRIAGQLGIRDDLAIFGSFGLQKGSYDTVNVAFQREREDWLTDVAAGLNWRYNDEWSVRPQASYSRNISNISLYAYDRKDISVTLRWDYR
jgi:tetratricopeptide (TPR) repeat protein